MGAGGWGMEAQVYVLFYAMVALPLLMLWPDIKEMLRIVFLMTSGITGVPWL